MYPSIWAVEAVGIGARNSEFLTPCIITSFLRESQSQLRRWSKFLVEYTTLALRTSAFDVGASAWCVSLIISEYWSQYFALCIVHHMSFELCRFCFPILALNFCHVCSVCRIGGLRRLIRSWEKRTKASSSLRGVSVRRQKSTYTSIKIQSEGHGERGKRKKE